MELARLRPRGRAEDLTRPLNPDRFGHLLGRKREKIAVFRRFSPVFRSALCFCPCRLDRVARAAEQLDVLGVQLRAAVLQFDDMVTEDPAA